VCRSAAEPVPIHMTTTNALHYIIGRPSLRLLAAAIVALALMESGSGRPIVQAQTNPTVVENALTGDSDWDISGGGAGDPTIQGFATNISVNTGETVDFKIK